VLDVGTGAAIHLQTSSGNWLFDCGSERSYKRSVRDYLHSAGVNSVTALILTHGDSQHIGGATQLISDLRPSVLIDNPAPDRSRIHKGLRTVMAGRNLAVRRPSQNETLAMDGELGCSVLYPPRDFAAAMGDDQTLVFQLKSNAGPRILLMSDSGLATEKALLDSGIDLRSDIVIKGQHHSGQSGSAEFLKAVRPKLVVATSRDFPRHERVDDQWIEQLRKQNIRVFRQSDTGAVEIFVRPNDWEARAYMTAETFRSISR
jgi:beta-lactamase superfamily II metal-dependent hydrolase